MTYHRGLLFALPLSIVEARQTVLEETVLDYATVSKSVGPIDKKELLSVSFSALWKVGLPQDASSV